MRNLIFQNDLPPVPNTHHPLPTCLSDYIDAMSIIDESSLRQDIVAFLPLYTHDMLLDIVDYIKSNKSSEFLPANREFQLSKLFTTHIPDIMWRHIQVGDDRDLVRLIRGQTNP